MNLGYLRLVGGSNDFAMLYMSHKVYIFYSSNQIERDPMVEALKIESYEDIENLMKNHVEESTRLEFKGKIDSNNKEIAKDISAMANAQGGLVIYGIERDDKYRATLSPGMMKEKGSVERLQQIIGSHIAPPLTVKIFQIPARDEKGDNSEDREFIVVKIPQSPYHIHMVETTGKFYIRANNIVQRMTESETEKRYEMRFKERIEREDLFEKKEKELQNRQNIDRYMFCGSVSHIRYGIPADITVELFEECRKAFHPEIYLYPRSHSRAGTSSLPKGDGRFYEDSAGGEYLEINNDKSAYFFILTPDPESGLFRNFYWFVYFLSIISNFYASLGYEGGITILLRFAGTKGMSYSIPSYFGPPYNAQEIVEESLSMEITADSVPFNLREIALKFFEDLGKRLHVDEPLKVWQNYVNKLEGYIGWLDKNSKI